MTVCTGKSTCWVLGGFITSAIVVLLGCSANAEGEAATTSRPVAAADGLEEPDAIGEFRSQSQSERLINVLYETNESIFNQPEVVAFRENFLAECMDLRGFEYVPFVPDTPPPQVPPLIDYRGPREFAETNGYGLLLENVEVARRMALASIAEPNPNEVIRSSFSEAELAAYFRALTGASIGDGPPPGDAAEASCAERFAEEVLDLPSLDSNDMATLRLRDDYIRTDREWIEAEEDWTSCMGAAGYASSIGSFDDLRTTLGDISAVAAASSVEVTESVTEPGTNEVVELTYQQYEEEVFEAQLREEIALAVSDLECRSLADLNAAYDQARAAADRRALSEAGFG
ncbi:MAG: hypothetical protein AAGD18_17470 [Actinomycetota bacterium]